MSDDSPIRDPGDSVPEDDADLRVPVEESYEATENRFEQLLTDFYA